MVKAVIRRSSDPSVVLQLWEAITCIRQSKQIANLDRIERFMERTYNVNSKECKRQMELAVQDNLLVKEVSKAKQSSCRVTVTQDGYWCAEERNEESEEPHDWYCFACHRGGEMLCCGTCHRVYHPECVQVEEPEKVLGLWFCPICESCRKKSLHISKWDLNKMLLHVVNRMKEKARELTKKLNLDELPNYYNLVYQHMDLSIIAQKLDEKKYRWLEEFQGDAKALVHVATIYHGAEHDKTKLCEQTLEDCMHDISEIMLCKDCFIMSNDRTQKDWFCRPCHPPHELVWARMKGFGYWPAKVLQRSEEKVDVRFFGSRHERAWIETLHVKGIETDKKKLTMKMSQGWRNAVQEMEKYQKNMDAMTGGGDPLSSSTSSSSSSSSMLQAKGTKRKHKSGRGRGRRRKEEEMDSLPKKEGGVKDEGVEEEEEKEAKGEARQVVRLSSTTDAGQDQSVSTSQISLDALDEPPVKKQKPAQATPSLPKAEDEGEMEMEIGGDECQATPPPPPLDEEEGSSSKTDVERDVSYKKQLDDAIKEALDKAKQEWQREKERLVKESKERLSAEIEKTRAETEERCKKEHNEQLQKLRDEISQTKKKQWCINCEKEAMYHCCWNTSYCSINCQQVHWHQEHKRLCRRKR